MPVFCENEIETAKDVRVVFHPRYDENAENK